MQTYKDIRFNVSSSRRLLLLICITVIGYIMSATIAAVVFKGGITPGRVSIITVIQDILVFILPALVTAVVITRRPAEFLEIQSLPGLLNAVIVLAILICAMPAMNALIEWNQNISLPQSMHGFSQWMREMEEAAQETVNVLFSGHTWVHLTVILLVVGVMAGLSEELFFRGTLQRLLVTGGLNPHLSIWAVAFIFSAVHMQFFGFIPRMVLGALFGYIAWWSGNVWLSVLAHIFNNVVAALVMWKSEGQSIDVTKSAFESMGSDFGIMFWVSIVASVTMLCVFYKMNKKALPS